jgi:tetratricopeptide (TPR) repeat protein
MLQKLNFSFFFIILVLISAQYANGTKDDKSKQNFIIGQQVKTKQQVWLFKVPKFDEQEKSEGATNGEQFEVLDIDNQFLKVKARSGRTGWVNKNSVISISKITQTSQDEFVDLNDWAKNEEKSELEGKFAFFADHAYELMPLYKEPFGDISEKVPKILPLHIIRAHERDSYYLVETYMDNRKVEGWVYNDYLSINQNAKIKYEDLEIERKNYIQNKINNILSLVQQIPLSNYEENLKYYKQLVNLDPTNESFEQKIDFYKNKIVLRDRRIQEQKHQEAIEAEKKKIEQEKVAETRKNQQERIREFANKVRIQEEEKREEEMIRKYQEGIDASKRVFDNFVKENKIEEWVNCNDLSVNPFRFGTKTIGIVTYFTEMITEKSGLFAGSKNCRFVASKVPTNIYSQVAEVLLIASIKGKKQFSGIGLLPHLEYIDSYFCTELDCQDFLIWAKELKIIEECKSLYNELVKFKDDTDFHKIGFSAEGPYHKWKENVEELKKNPDSKLLLENGIVVGDIEMLGSEYRKSKGKETDYTKYMVPEIKSALNIK